ncbi:pilus assembly FimT family protein [Litoreibacter meonggei]|uniref:pilus assembly FimT family protein n=1 Tax=Litoreibacter meonggei TaxID=1049199 RepID=UPI000EB5762C|nr:prepilin-type N-terminal cleavage/methylation domain-containing protein [Litoreibacter meonggei]
MTLPSNPERRNAGFTLFEALVSLALIALVLAVGVSAARPPSPALQANAAFARLSKSATQAKLEAITQHRTAKWSPDAPLCEESTSVEFKFFADGTAHGPDLCILQMKLRLHRLTGLLQEIPDE